MIVETSKSCFQNRLRLCSSILLGTYDPTSINPIFSSSGFESDHQEGLKIQISFQILHKFNFVTTNLRSLKKISKSPCPGKTIIINYIHFPFIQLNNKIQFNIKKILVLSAEWLDRLISEKGRQFFTIFSQTKWKSKLLFMNFNQNFFFFFVSFSCFKSISIFYNYCYIILFFAFLAPFWEVLALFLYMNWRHLVERFLEGGDRWGAGV